MRRRAFTMDEELTRGLRTDKRLERRNRALSGMINLRPFPIGAVALPSRENAFPDKTISWPFPQLFKGKDFSFLMGETSISLVTDKLPLVETPLTTFDADDPDFTLAIPAGESWHFMDFGDSFMFFNGQCIIIRSRINLVDSTEADKVLVRTHLGTIPVTGEERPPTQILTGCANRGRGFFGGFPGNDFWSDAWDTIWQDLSGTETDLSRNQPLTDNFVWWSQIGGGDLLWIFRPDLAQTGVTGKGYTTSDPFILDWLRRNQFGFMPMPWQGSVLKCLPLGQNVVVYGSDGISVLVPQTVGDFATFGLVELRRHGIAGRGAAGGDDQGHVFIDDSGFLWVLGVDLKATRLGYREFFKPMLGTDKEIMVVQDPIENDFYISDGDRGYVLTENGLSEITQPPTSVIAVEVTGTRPSTSISSTLVSMHRVGGREWLIRSNVMDFGSRDVKVLYTVEVAATGVSMIEVLIETRDNGNLEWQHGEWIPASDDGNAFVHEAGVEIRVSVRGTLEPDPDADIEPLVSYINIGWGLMGRRHPAGELFQGAGVV